MCERLQRKDITNVTRSFIAGDRSVVQSLISQSATLPEMILCQAVTEGDGGEQYVIGQCPETGGNGE